MTKKGTAKKGTAKKGTAKKGTAKKGTAKKGTASRQTRKVAGDDFALRAGEWIVEGHVVSAKAGRKAGEYTCLVRPGTATVMKAGPSSLVLRTADDDRAAERMAADTAVADSKVLPKFASVRAGVRGTVVTLKLPQPAKGAQPLHARYVEEGFLDAVAYGATNALVNLGYKVRRSP